MEFIQNTREGSQLDKLNATAVAQAKSVLAAVAYVTDSRSLIDACMPNEFPPRNGRTSKALKALGFAVCVYNE
jgi:3-dehydroquinate dehydratase